MSFISQLHLNWFGFCVETSPWITECIANFITWPFWLLRVVQAWLYSWNIFQTSPATPARALTLTELYYQNNPFTNPDYHNQEIQFFIFFLCCFVGISCIYISRVCQCSYLGNPFKCKSAVCARSTGWDLIFNAIKHLCLGHLPC